MKELLFIHIPKTAGSYVRQYNTKNKDVLGGIKTIGHGFLGENGKYKKILPFKGLHHTHNMNIIPNDIIIFCNIRNLFSWFVSYAMHSGGWNPKYRDTNHYDYKNANKGVDYLIKKIAERDYDDYWPNRGMIHCQMFSDNGNFMLDWVNRVENLDHNLNNLAKFSNRKYTKMEKVRVENIKNEDYKKYYDDKLISFVIDTWGFELDFLGYGFDKYNIDCDINEKINNDVKNKYKYDFITKEIIK